MKEELLKGLSEEQISKIKECKNHEEVLELAKEEGIELTDEQLTAISGGCGDGTTTKLKQGKVLCPYCHSDNNALSLVNGQLAGYVCYNCNKRFDRPYRK